MKKIQQFEQTDSVLAADQAVSQQIPPQESFPHELGDTVPAYPHYDLVCNFCDKEFRNEAILKDHTRIEHNSGRIRYRQVERT